MKTILVIGAEGERVATELVHRGGFVVNSLPAEKLADRATLRAAIKGAWGVFAVTADEVHGRNLINAVAGGEVEQFVFGSRVAAEQLETYAVSLGLPATFVRDFNGDLSRVVADAFID